MASERDPLIDPKSGDEVCGYDQGSPVVRIRKADDEKVEYEIPPLRGIYIVPLEEYRRWAKAAQVIHAAQ